MQSESASSGYDGSPSFSPLFSFFWWIYIDDDGGGPF